MSALDLTQYFKPGHPQGRVERLRRDLSLIQRCAAQVTGPREVVLGESAHRLLFEGLKLHHLDFLELGKSPHRVIMTVAGAARIVLTGGIHPTTMSVRPLERAPEAWAASCPWVGPTWLYRPSTEAVALAVVTPGPDGPVARIMSDTGALKGEVLVSRLEADGVCFVPLARPQAPEEGALEGGSQPSEASSSGGGGVTEAGGRVLPAKRPQMQIGPPPRVKAPDYGQP